MQLRHLLMASAVLYGTHAFAQPTTASRLIAYATSIHNNAQFVNSDSSYMTYTNDRGGDNINSLKFDRKTDMTYNTSNYSYVNSFRTSQTWDANNNLLNSLSEVYDAPSSSWMNYTNVTNTYENNNLSTHITQYWDIGSQSWEGGNGTKVIYFFNGNTSRDSVLPDTMITQSWNMSTMDWTNSNMQINSFDIDGRLLIQTFFNWDGSSAWNNSYRIIYSYTGNTLDAQITQYWSNASSAWINYNRNLYTYDAMGHMLTNTANTWNSSSNMWMNTSKTTRTYNTRNDMESSLYQVWSNGNNNWLNANMQTYTYDTLHNNTTEVYMVWNSNTNLFRNITKYQRTYNMRGQMTTETSQSWNIGGFWETRGDNIYRRYHYQAYTLGIDNAASTSSGINNLKMYPVPATNLMTIEAAWETPQDFTVTIMDMTGRVARQWNEKATANYRKTVPVSEIPAGNYILRVKSGNTQSVQQFSIAH